MRWQGWVGAVALGLMVGCFDFVPRQARVSLERSLCTYYSSCSLPVFVLYFGEQGECEEALAGASPFLADCEYDLRQESACRQQIDLMVGSCGDITTGDCEAVLACPDERCEQGYQRLVDCGVFDEPFSPEFCLGFASGCELECLVNGPEDCDNVLPSLFTCRDDCDFGDQDN